MLNQTIEFNMENPEADSKKGRPRNSALFLLNDKKVTLSIVEKQFRLEFDENAMLATMRDGLEASNSKAFETIKKKKVQTNQENEKMIFGKDVDFTDVLKKAETAYPSLDYAEFAFELDD